MSCNKLKFNDSKTEFLILGTRQQVSKISDCSKTITVDTAKIQTSTCVRNLGVTFESDMNMNKHISKVTSTCYYHLRNIAHIRRYLTPSAAESIIHSLISSRLDYCNSLFLGIPQYQLKKLQSVQNTAARILTYVSKYDHITHKLKELHWLPVTYRVHFKICLIVYKALHGLAPQYIRDLLTLKIRTRSLRKKNMLELYEPRAKLSGVDNRSFSFAGPRLWNSLPNDIKGAENVSSFKKLLKTYLFALCFN